MMPHDKLPAYVDTPKGLFTASGVWFATTEAALKTYAAPVLERIGLARLLREASVWLRSPEVACLWAVPLFLWRLPPGAAALAALTLYVGWKALAPVLVFPRVVAVFAWLDRVGLQAAYYVLLLSYLALQGQLAAMTLGLVAFILLRWGVLDRLTRPLVRPLWRSLFRLPVSDQVLRALIVRYALRYGLVLSELDRMERALLDRLGRSRPAD